MPAETAILIGIGMFLALFGILTVVYVIYDKGRIAVEYRTSTGDVDVKLKRPSEHGLELDEGNHPEQQIVPRTEFMGTWHGSWKPWTYPLITVDAETGNVLERRDIVAVHTRDEDDYEPEDIPAELVQVSWPHVYWNWLDSDAVKEALESQKSIWSRMAGALIIGFVIIALAFVFMVFTLGGG